MALLIIAALTLSSTATPARADIIELTPEPPISADTVIADFGDGSTMEIVLATPTDTGNNPDVSVSPGWTSVTIRLSASDQRLAVAGNAGALGAAICYATALLGCAAAGAIASMIIQFVGDRGGICSGGRTLVVNLRYGVPPLPNYIRCS